MKNDPHAYLHRTGLPSGGAGPAVHREPPMSTPGPNARKLGLQSSMSPVSTGKKVDQGATQKAGKENIEGNESPAYERLEKRSMRTLKAGGSEKELRAGHNEKTYKGKSMAPGGGGSFAKLKDEIAAKGNVRNPAAVAASIGRRKYGATKMAKFSAEGRARAARGK